eukprot:CAMPEP_0117525740 /NCGR_PEP_ID=MMETSP0784-20121206/35927_1 /TAXON_ID=39447 /ORGANISM="" /LENGTH=112 /DNA_ID=CAMNT_0005321949 /DNA_START=39 /DNA_END=377 /DNA_ORIENTATION=+
MASACVLELVGGLEAAHVDIAPWPVLLHGFPRLLVQVSVVSVKVVWQLEALVDVRVQELNSLVLVEVIPEHLIGNGPHQQRGDADRPRWMDDVYGLEVLRVSFVQKRPEAPE